MKLLIVVLSLAAAAYAGDVAPVIATTPADDKPIRVLVNTYVDAWNHRDARASADAFVEDGDLSGNQGLHARGRSAIEQLHEQMFKTRFKEGHLTSLDVKSHYTAPHSAMVDILWEVSGVKPDGKPVALRRGISNWLVMGEGNDWQIISMQNHEFSPHKQCVNQGFDRRQLAPLVCWFQRTMSWKSNHEPNFLLIGKSKGMNLGLAFPPYVVLNLPGRHHRWNMFRAGFRYDRTWRGYIFPTLAFKSTAQPLRY